MARALLIGAAASAWAAVAAASCSARLHTPQFGPHTSLDTFENVPAEPPEPVQVQEVPAASAAAAGAVWVDGYWDWIHKRWEWHPGAWQVPPPGAYYARPALVRIPVAVYGEADGGPAQVRGYAVRLMFISGHWHLPDGRQAPALSASGSAR